MINIIKIYDKEKTINSKFKEKYNYSDPTIFYKQVLELIVEISELAYETKCFKYWKTDKPSPAEITIPEYADCLMITLCLCDLANIEINNLINIKEDDMVKIFIKLNYLASQITMDLNEKLLLEILSYLLKLSKLLGFTDNQLEEYCFDKMERTLKMITEQIK